jgi:hypothetical protein
MRKATDADTFARFSLWRTRSIGFSENDMSRTGSADLMLDSRP